MVAISQPQVDLLSAENVTLEAIASTAEFVNSSERNKLDFTQKVNEEASKPGRKNYLGLGSALAILGKYDAAIETLEKADESKEKYFELAFCLRKTEEYDRAIESLDKAGNIGADGLVVNCAKASIYRVKGDFEKALKTLSAYENYQKVSALYHYTLGRCLQSQGKYDEAIENYQAAVEIEPTHPKALFHLAFLLDIRGDEEAAINYYKQLIGNGPVYVSALLNMVVLYEDMGEYDKAFKCVNQVLKFHPNNERAILFKKDIESSKTMLYDEEIEKSKDIQHRTLETPISDFELSVRSRNCLKKMNIFTIGDLMRITETELLAYKNFGETSLNEIKQMLESKGLRLGMAIEGKPTPSILPEILESETDIDPELLNKPLADFEMSVRARKCLEHLNIRTIGDIIGKTEAELLGVKNFGATSLIEINQILEPLGLSLRRLD
ncbi:MAG: tetratricopeptide repeat protein [Sedimentisphaerales bacterium]|nr:tetratricopeptide repeat protein [Sedimentisphaerales bacterium]